jgi:hypothetical protein
VRGASARASAPAASTTTCSDRLQISSQLAPASAGTFQLHVHDHRPAAESRPLRLFRFLRARLPPDPSARGAADGGWLPGSAGLEHLEHAGREPPGGGELRQRHQPHRRCRHPASGFRHGLGGGADRHPLRHGAQRAGDAADRFRLARRLARRERPRAVPDSAGPADRRRRYARQSGRPPHPRRSPGRLHPLRALPLVGGGRLQRRVHLRRARPDARLVRPVGSGLQPRLERPAPGRLDLGRRRRPADLPRPGALRRSRDRRDPPRLALYRRCIPHQLGLAGAARGRRHQRRQRPADGTPAAHEGELRPVGVRPRACAPSSRRSRSTA